MLPRAILRTTMMPVRLPAARGRIEGGEGRGGSTGVVREMIGLWREVRERGGTRSPAANSRACVTRVAKRRHKALLVVSDKPENKLPGQMLLVPTIELPRYRRPSPLKRVMLYSRSDSERSLSRRIARAIQSPGENAIP